MSFLGRPDKKIFSFFILYCSEIKSIRFELVQSAAVESLPAFILPLQFFKGGHSWCQLRTIRSNTETPAFLKNSQNMVAFFCEYLPFSKIFLYNILFRQYYSTFHKINFSFYDINRQNLS